MHKSYPPPNTPHDAAHKPDAEFGESPTVLQTTALTNFLHCRRTCGRYLSSMKRRKRSFTPRHVDFAPSSQSIHEELHM